MRTETRVPTGQDCWCAAAVRQSDRDLLITLQRVLRRNDDIRPPHHAARRPVLPPMHRYHRATSAFHRAGEVIR